MKRLRLGILFLCIFCFCVTKSQEQVERMVGTINEYLDEQTEWSLSDSILYCISRSSYYISKYEVDSALYSLTDAEILSERLEDQERLIALSEIYQGYASLSSENNNERLYWLLKAESIYLQLDLTSNRPYATLVAHIADAYKELEDSNNAIIYANTYLTLYRSYFNYEESENVATELRMIADCYAYAEKYDDAIFYMNKAITMMGHLLGVNHPYYASYIRGLAHIYADYGKMNEAEALLVHAIEIISEREAEYICPLANWNMELSDFYMRDGKIIESVDLLLGIAPQHLDCYGETPELMMKIARACWITNNSDKIFTYINRSFLRQKEKTLFDIGQTYSRYKLEKTPSILYETIFEYVVDNLSNLQMDSLAYEARLFSEGLVLHSERIMRVLSMTNSDTSIINHSQEKSTFENDKRKQANDLFAEHEMITAASKQHYSELKKFMNKGIPEIQRMLTKEDIAIELIVSTLQGGAIVKKGHENYLALILRKDWDTPKCVILGEEAQLENMIYPELQQAVWQAIIDSAQIKEGENIYFAPDGIFYNVPIEYLPTADGRNMSDVYNMFRVSSTRELCFRDSTKQAYSSAVLYGGLKYDAAPQHNLYAQNRSDYRGIDNMSKTVWTQWRAEDRAKYNYLPYTLKEVDSISNTINGSLQVTTYTDVYGDEKSFKALSGNSPSILHVATHGYYITPTQAEVMSRERLSQYGVSPTDERQSVIDYSMERTGLLLAGAQYTLRGDTLPQDADDGILSAKEISHLDLTNTDLVVLSACKTALGDITNDGVAGLQRGFKIAGVKSILMSLWQVDDAATYLLMKRFYQSLVSGKSKQQALREAQQALRSYKTQDDYPYSDIRYWGAFVLLDAIE